MGAPAWLRVRRAPSAGLRAEAWWPQALTRSIPRPPAPPHLHARAPPHLTRTPPTIPTRAPAGPHLQRRGRPLRPLHRHRVVDGHVRDAAEVHRHRPLGGLVRGWIAGELRWRLRYPVQRQLHLRHGARRRPHGARDAPRGRAPPLLQLCPGRRLELRLLRLSSVRGPHWATRGRLYRERGARHPQEWAGGKPARSLN